MTDPRIAALAEALENHRPVGLSEVQIAHDRGRCGIECAAAILAALPPSFFRDPDDVMTLDLMEAAIRNDQAEIARLRKIEEAARTFVNDWEGLMDDGDDIYIDALRAALEAER